MSFACRPAALVLLATSLLFAPVPSPALVDSPAARNGIDAHGDFHGFLRTQNFHPGSDFRAERLLAPGVLHTFESRAEGPLTFSAVTIDLSREDLVLEAEKGQDLFTGRERLDAMSSRLADPTARPLVLVNGDFWGDRSIPVGLFVDEGTVWRGPFTNAAGRTRSVFAFDDQGNLFIGLPEWSAQLTSPDATRTLPLSAVNLVPSEPWQAMAFTWPLGDSAPAATEGVTAVILQLPGGEWLPNAPAPATIQSIGEEGPLPLARDRVIVHLNGKTPEWMAPGAQVLLSARIAQLPGRVIGVIGGGPILVQENEVVAASAPEREAIGMDFVTARHPRTAIGIKEDGRTLVVAVIDGRQNSLSIGINLPDLGQWMLDQGCVVAMNLDGGGSSTLAVREEVVNFPSDNTGPRLVSNALVVRRTALLGDVAALGIRPTRTLVPAGGQVGLSAHLFDANLEPLDFIRSGVEIDWTQEEALPGGAVVTDDGTLILSRELPGTTLSVRARAVRRTVGRAPDGERTRDTTVLAEATATVEVANVERLEARPSSLLLTVGETIPLQIGAFAPGGRRFPTTRPQFSVKAPPFIDWPAEESSVLTATAPGTGAIEVTYGSKSMRVLVAVDEYDTELLQTFDALPPGDLSQWIGLTRANPEATGLALDNQNQKEGFAAWQWNYAMTPGGTSKIALPLRLSIPGEPLALGVWVHGDGNGQWLRGTLVDTYGARVTLDFTSEQAGIDFDGEWRFLRASIIQAAPATAAGNPFSPPFRLEELYLVQPREDRKRDGTILIDALTGLYLPKPR